MTGVGHGPQTASRLELFDRGRAHAPSSRWQLFIQRS